MFWAIVRPGYTAHHAMVDGAVERAVAIIEAVASHGGARGQGCSYDLGFRAETQRTQAHEGTAAANNSSSNDVRRHDSRVSPFAEDT